MKRLLLILFIVVGFGCAKVNLATKEPLRVDINMQVDIYQHVVEDVKSINDQIYGTEHKKLNSLFFIKDAYAQDSNPALTSAIARRKNRFANIEEYFVMGYIGENRSAFLEIRAQIPAAEKTKVEVNVELENKDRQIIYKAIAEKDNSTVAQVQKLFYEDDYNRALSGFLFEVLKENQYVWQEK
tara:strand:+ start:256 stop:807 length:552 start_codon:yes stop_codon:yes gene_type:complete